MPTIHATAWTTCEPTGRLRVRSRTASTTTDSEATRGTASEERSPAFPDVPTMKELGYDVEYYLWVAVFAPKNIPVHAFQALQEATRKAVQEPDFRSAMDKIQVPIAYQSADEFNAWWDADARRLAAVIKRIGRVDTKN